MPSKTSLNSSKRQVNDNYCRRNRTQSHQSRSIRFNTSPRQRSEGIPHALILTVANRHDVTQLLPLIDAIPTQIARRVSPTVVALANLMGHRTYNRIAA